MKLIIEAYIMIRRELDETAEKERCMLVNAIVDWDSAPNGPTTATKETIPGLLLYLQLGAAGRAAKRNESWHL